MKKKNKIITIIVIILLLISGIFIFKHYNKKSINDEYLENTLALIEKQQKLEKKIKTKGFTFDKPNVILDPYENSPLSALIIFDTKEAEEPIVTIKGKDEHTTFTHKFGIETHHELPIYGLYPDFNNTVIIKIGEKEKVINIKTEELPKGFILPTSVRANKGKLGNELYFMAPSGLNKACAYDINGDVRWYLNNVALWENSKLENGHIMVSTERIINRPYYTTGLYEIDFLGRVYKEYSLPGGYHHDYYEMPNGNLLVASNLFNNPDGTVEDYIVEINRKTGKIVKKFNLRNVLAQNDSKSENWCVYDWFHNNAVWYDEKTNSITLSGRHQDAVINIDYKTGKLNWIIGDPTNWSNEYQKYFFTPIGDNFEWQWSQHAAMITPEGYVFI